MQPSLPFRLKVPGKDEVRGFRAISTSFRFRGILRMEATELMIEWGGEAQVQDVGATAVRDDRLPLPNESIVVPPGALHRATLAGGWWRPRLTLQARSLGTLAIVPSEEHGVVHFWIARGDRASATALVMELNAAISKATG